MIVGKVLVLNYDRLVLYWNERGLKKMVFKWVELLMRKKYFV